MTATLITQWLGLACIVLALATGLGAAAARSYFVLCVFMAAAAVFVALALLSFGAGQAAAALAIIGVAMIPALLLGGLLLSGRAIRSKRRAGAPWLTVLALAAFAALVVWGVSDVAPLRAPVAPPVGLSAWLAPLLLAAAAIGAGLLGFGERGALERRRDGSGA